MPNTHAGLFSGCPVVKCGAVAHSSSADGDEGNGMADLGGIGSNGKWNWRCLLYTSLQHFRGMASAMGMLFAQNIINFFVPSGAGQALITMPILAPVGEMVGVSRQVSVLAYQFGDGFSNIFWPTSVFMMCGIKMCIRDSLYPTPHTVLMKSDFPVGPFIFSRRCRI